MIGRGSILGEVDGFRGGVEYGFMSTTSKREVAAEYARGGHGLIFEIYMGMVDKGADLHWLSQYPHEQVCHEHSCVKHGRSCGSCVRCV